jgi:iron complex outermembrane receptor protein
VFKLFDLQSIEVLEGPQGTLFGRNVSGGAVVIETKKPSFDRPALTAEASGGNLGDNEYAGLVNVPVSSIAAFNLSADYQKRDGWGVDRLTGVHEDGIDSQNYRGDFRLRPRDDLNIVFGADYSYDKNGGRTLSSTSSGADGDPRTSELGVPQSFNRTLAGTSLKVVWSPPQGELTSITAYRKDESGEAYSGVAANYRFLTSGSQTLDSDKDQVGDFTQELRYASPRWSRGDFVAGFYFLSEDGARELGVNGLAAQTGALASSTLANEHVDTTSYAFFLDGTVHILPTLDFTAGARYTEDQKTANLNYLDLVHAANDFTVRGSKASWDQWTPRAVLTWRPMHEALAYASVTRGFTAGGFNTDASSVQAFAKTFQPEVVTNYELGAKTQWFENRLRLNASLFDMQYHNKQELVFNSTNGILDIVNAASATSRGFEATAAAKLFPWLDLTAGYARLVTKYNSFVLGSTNNTGHELSSSPPNKYSIDAEFNYPLDGRGFLIGSANYSWIDDYNTGAAGDPRLEIHSYGLTNLNAGYETPDRHYRLSAWVRNLSNTNYVLTNSTQTITGTYLGEPRTYGVTLRVNY